MLVLSGEFHFHEGCSLGGPISGSQAYDTPKIPGTNSWVSMSLTVTKCG